MLDGAYDSARLHQCRVRRLALEPGGRRSETEMSQMKRRDTAFSRPIMDRAGSKSRPGSPWTLANVQLTVLPRRRRRGQGGRASGRVPKDMHCPAM